MGAKMLAHRRLNYTNAIFSSGLTHLNMNSYPRLTRFKYEIALNCVSPNSNKPSAKKPYPFVIPNILYPVHPRS